MTNYYVLYELTPFLEENPRELGLEYYMAHKI